MSSLHQDRLLEKGSRPVTGSAAARPTASGGSRRAVAPTEGMATSTVPTQRLGTAQRTGATQPEAPAESAPRSTRGTSRAAAVAGSLAASARAATVRAATAKAATARRATVTAASARTATAKAATAARAAAVSTVVNHRAGVRSARAAAAGKAASTTAAPGATEVAAAAEPTVAKAAGTRAARAGKHRATGPTRARVTSIDSVARQGRPTPHRRTAPQERVPTAQAALAGTVPVIDGAAPGTVETPDVVVRRDVPADGAPTPAGRRPRPLLHRRRPSGRRRPALYLTAAIASAISLSAFSAQDPPAQATTTASQSVSVAEQLGIDAAASDAPVDATAATDRLGELAVSRNTREAEQVAAIHAQTEADRLAVEAAAAAAAAAAEAARPDAVLPVQGARLTSGFGARWGTLHAGIDLAAPMHTPEYAVMDGVVLEAGPASGFGLAVYIQHDNGDVTVYGHMDEILVQAGQVVRAGDTIALLGNRGQSTGPHLHFEVHVGGLDGTKVDPLPWLRAAGVDI